MSYDSSPTAFDLSRAFSYLYPVTGLELVGYVDRKPVFWLTGTGICYVPYLGCVMFTRPLLVRSKDSMLTDSRRYIQNTSILCNKKKRERNVLFSTMKEEK